jgi:hypothetical protein
MKEMTVSQYAKKYRITRQAVLKRIWHGSLKARKVGNYYIIGT